MTEAFLSALLVEQNRLLTVNRHGEALCGRKTFFLSKYSLANKKNEAIVISKLSLAGGLK